jgi:uncharacterized OB-fold protein
MSNSTYAGPKPVPTPETKPYWDAARRHVLAVQRCQDCRQCYFYPRPLCPHCLSRRVGWIECSGRGTLHTFVINYRPPRNFPLQEPFVIAMVQLEEGPRILTNLVEVEADPKAIRCDMPVEVVFDDVTPEISLPKFRPAR